MRVQDMMSAPVETLEASDTVALAIQKMHESKIRHVVVIEHGQIAGIVSEYEMRVAPHEALLSEWMSRGVATVNPHITVREAANILRGRAISCLVVVANGKPAGVVTVADLLELIGKGIEKPVARGRRRTIFRRGPRVKPVS